MVESHDKEVSSEIKELTQIANDAAESIRNSPIFNIPSSYKVPQFDISLLTSTVLEAQKVFNNGLQEQIRILNESANLFFENLKKHYPSNWPANKASRCAEICEMGIPLVFVPRSEIIAKVVDYKLPSSIKSALVRNDDEILDDCELALESVAFISRDFRQHANAAIKAYRDGNWRAAQSTAIVCFDVLTNDLYDMRMLRKINKRVLAYRKVEEVAKQITQDIDQMPIDDNALYYALVMHPTVAAMLEQFMVGDKTSLRNGLNRHASAHTVSSKQFKKSNALIAIMTIVSLCMITEKQGRFWMSKMFNYLYAP